MILQEIADKTKERIAEAKRRLPISEVKAYVADMDCGRKYPFEQALSGEGVGYICEVKKASPSKGVIAEEFPYLKIAEEYEAAGADAISVLTEPFYFQGRDAYLHTIRKAVNLPLLRKDFTVDEYMIYEAKKLKADAVLLICSILSQSQLSEYVHLADSIGLSVLTEAHDEKEIEMALSAGTRIIGVNNRNLKDFTVDISNSVRLRRMVPEHILFLSESGVKGREDIVRLEENGTDAVLIGETLMRSQNKRASLEALRGK